MAKISLDRYDYHFHQNLLKFCPIKELLVMSRISEFEACTLKILSNRLILLVHVRMKCNHRIQDENTHRQKYQGSTSARPSKYFWSTLPNLFLQNVFTKLEK